MTPDQGVPARPDRQEADPPYFNDYLQRDEALNVDNRLFVRFSRTRRDLNRNIRLPELKIVAPSNYNVAALFAHGLYRNMITNYQDGVGTTGLMLYPALEGIEVGKYSLGVKTGYSPEGILTVELDVESPNIMGHVKIPGIRTREIAGYLSEALAAEQV